MLTSLITGGWADTQRILLFNNMAKTKKVTLSMTEETEKIAQEDSVEVLGSKNVSGYISYLIKKARKEVRK